MGIGKGKPLVSLKKGRECVGVIKRYGPGGFIFEANWDAPEEVPSTIHGNDIEALKRKCQEAGMTTVAAT